MTAPVALRIAIADDNPHDRVEAKAALLRGSSTRYVFREFEAGEPMLAACHADPPDCLVLDFALNDMDGFEALARLPRDGDGLMTIPVVVLTGSVDGAESRRLIRAGAMDFLGKDWMTPGSLTRAVENALERHAMLKEQAERTRRLRDSERRFEALADLVPQLVWAADAEGRNEYVNRRWREYTGQAPDDAAGDGWAAVVHPDDAAHTLEAWRAARRDGSLYEAEHRMRRHDGSYRTFLARALPLRDEDGAIVRWFGTSTDVEAGRQLQQQLRDSGERLELAQAAAGIGTWEWDPETRRVYWSAELYRLLGIDPGDPGFYELWRGRLDGYDLSTTSAVTLRVLGGETVEHEYRYRHPRLGERWMLSKARLMNREGGGRVIYGATFDITDRKRLEHELQDSDRRKDEFLAMLAHELRNPLAPLRSGVEVLRRLTNAAPDVHRTLSMMERQTAHLARLVDDLLDISRITRGRIELRLDRVELGALLDEVVEGMQPQLRERRHELVLERPATGVAVRGDPVRLAQVVDNVLSNSVKYTDPGGRIVVRLAAAADEATITVRDNGIGIAPDLLPRVFDLFVQNERTLERAQGGLGIGLSLVRRLVEMHGGRVEALSEGLGHGAEFRVHLPLADARQDAAPARAPPVRVAPSGDAARRILIVDDNRDSADSLALWLRLEGHGVEVAYDAHQGLAHARTQAFDAVLLDIGLPDLDGYEVARRLRADPATRGLLMVAVTGYGQQADKQRALEVGFDHHATKPVDPERLTALLVQPPEPGRSGPAVTGAGPGG